MEGEAKENDLRPISDLLDIRLTYLLKIYVGRSKSICG